ncbi:MAG TPA: hypothetical protein VGH74_17615 [Planctomycetaceae bacterium]
MSRTKMPALENWRPHRSSLVFCMSRIAILLMWGASLTGCAASRPSTQISQSGGFEAVGKVTVFDSDHLADIPTGRFCRVHSTNPDTLHEGTIVAASADEVVLCDAAVVGPRTMGLFGNIPFEWSRRASHGVDVTFPDRVAIPRSAIESIDVFDAQDTERLRGSFSDWRAKQKRVQENLVTDQEFPNSG